MLPPSPSLLNRCCNLRRSVAAVFGLKATKYQSGLAAVARKPSERGRVGVGMARYIFADGSVIVTRQAAQRLRRDFWMLADRRSK